MNAAKLEIKEISEVEDKEYWINKIGESDWRAGKYFSSLLRDGSFLHFVRGKIKGVFADDGRK